MPYPEQQTHGHVYSIREAYQGSPWSEVFSLYSDDLAFKCPRCFDMSEKPVYLSRESTKGTYWSCSSPRRHRYQILSREDL